MNLFERIWHSIKTLLTPSKIPTREELEELGVEVNKKEEEVVHTKQARSFGDYMKKEDE